MSDRWQEMMRSLRQRFGADASPEDVSAFLAAAGYDRGQIGEIVTRWRTEVEVAEEAAAAGTARTAGSAVGEGAEADDEPARRSRRRRRTPWSPVRVLGPHEWGRFAPEAWGRLVSLQATGALSILDLERVIEHALEQGEGRVGLTELQAILEGIGLGGPEPGADADPVTIH